MKKDFDFQKFMLLSTILYLGLLIKIIVFKNGTYYQNNINLTLFSFIKEYQYLGITKNFIINVFGNIILFMPLSIILKYYFNFLRNGHIIFIGTFTSISFELIQLATNWGIFDVDDVLLNTLGTILGILVYYLIKKIRHYKLIIPIILSSFTTVSILSIYSYYPRLIFR